MQPHFNAIEFLAERSPNDYTARNSPTRRSYGLKAMEVLVVVKTVNQIELVGVVDSVGTGMGVVSSVVCDTSSG